MRRRRRLPGAGDVAARGSSRGRVAVTIEDLSHDGRGIARIDGKVAFVAGALPGESILATPRRRHRRHDEYELVEVVEPAGARTIPRCPLTGTCGGCDLQHLAGAEQLRHKSRTVLDLLARQAKVFPEQVDEPLVSAPFGYRRRARLAVHVEGRGGRPVVGFRAAGSHRLVAAEGCPILVPALQALPGLLQETLGTLRVPGNLAQVEVALSEGSDGSSHALIHGHAAAVPGDDDLATLEAFACRQEAYLSVAVRDGAVFDLHRPSAEEPGYLLPAFALRIGFRGGDFVQANGSVNRSLVERVADWLEEYRGARVVDAFAGIGNFSLALARRGFSVLGIDAVPGMVARAEQNARSNVVDAEFQARDLLGGAATDWRGFDLAVVDPPRTGAQALVGALAEHRVPTILYVSCSAPTLARDASVLAASGYRLVRLAQVDMFPQTRHIETMGLFIRDAHGRSRGCA